MMHGFLIYQINEPRPSWSLFGAWLLFIQKDNVVSQQQLKEGNYKYLEIEAKRIHIIPVYYDFFHCTLLNKYVD